MGLIECVAKDLMEHENDGGQGETARATSFRPNTINHKKESAIGFIDIACPCFCTFRMYVFTGQQLRH